MRDTAEQTLVGGQPEPGGQGEWRAAGEMGGEWVSEGRVSLQEQRMFESFIKPERSQAKGQKNVDGKNHRGGIKIMN